MNNSLWEVQEEVEKTLRMAPYWEEAEEVVGWQKHPKRKEEKNRIYQDGTVHQTLKKKIFEGSSTSKNLSGIKISSEEKKKVLVKRMKYRICLQRNTLTKQRGGDH